MESIISYIFYIGLTSGILLIVMLLISILVGGDTDIDLDMDGGADVSIGDADAGFGLIKSILTLVSISCLSLFSLYLLTEWPPFLLILAAVLAGFVALYLLSIFFKFLLRQQESGNWHMWEALHEKGKVYIPIPEGGKGSVIIPVNGVEREIQAISEDGKAIAANEKIYVSDTHEDYITVMKAQ